MDRFQGITDGSGHLGSAARLQRRRIKLPDRTERGYDVDVRIEFDYAHVHTLGGERIFADDRSEVAEGFVEFINFAPAHGSRSVHQQAASHMRLADAVNPGSAASGNDVLDIVADRDVLLVCKYIEIDLCHVFIPPSF